MTYAGMGFISILHRLSVLPRVATYSYSRFNRRRLTMAIPTFDQMRACIAPIWQEEEYERDILWAGIFGSVSRDRAHENSDVDILIVLKEHERSGEPIDLREKLAEACGCEVSLMCIWQGPDWAWGHVRVEALLSSRTVYGNSGDVEHLRCDAMTILDDGLKRLNLIAEAVEKIKSQIATVQTYQNFIQPTREGARQDCIQELRTIVDLLDIQPLHHPIRTMLIRYALEYADEIRAHLDKNSPGDSNVETATFWRVIWDTLQPDSPAMWSFVSGCAVGGRKYIQHMLASKRLADKFEEGSQPDSSMYNEILR